MTVVPAALGAASGSAPKAPYVISEEKLEGPHGVLGVRAYLPSAAAGPGIVWVHGGGFANGDLNMPESDWVARQFAARGIAVVSVDYRLAPIPAEWAARSSVPARDGVHYPVASEEVEHAFRWAAASGLTAGEWALGGASAGGNLATGACLRLVRGDGVSPASVVLAYPTLHAVQSVPGAALRAKLDLNPSADRFGPESVRAMYENYLGASIATADVFAVPGLAAAHDLKGFPPVIMVTADVDELRVSGEAFAETLHEAGVAVDLRTAVGAQHGYLNVPEDSAAAPTIDAFAAHIHGRRDG
ncbi:alpha/beta hydrolase fold domain-containing protein [Microbacterium sp. BWT-B31]|uniref:alpha/beta hydrolase n=1 Tax=Microbacterium sp. BWT-B31 TaxID=3232072 RepID=UPI00352844EA